MKKLFILFLTAAAVLTTGCATTTDTRILVLTPKNGDTVQFSRDLAQCKYDTSQRHRAKDPQHEALLVDCMTTEKGYTLIERK